MLEKKYIYMLLFRFFPLNLRGWFRSNIKKQPVSRFLAGFTPSPSSYSSPVLPCHLFYWCAARFLMLQLYKSTHLTPHTRITCTSHFPLFVLSVCLKCCDIKLQRGMKSITPAMRGSHTLINDPVQIVYSQAGAFQWQFILRSFYYQRYDAWWCPPPTKESSYSISVPNSTEFSGDSSIQGQCRITFSEWMFSNRGSL